MNPTQQKAYDDATKAAQSAAEVIGGTYSPTTGYKPITSEKLAPTEAVKLPPPPEPSPVHDTSGLAQVDPYAVTPAQQKAQDLSDKILADLELQQTVNREKAGMELAQLSPLQEQERQFINEQNALINEQNAIPGMIQNEARGKGLTAGGVSPLEMAKKRENLQNIYLNQAKLDAVRGNITSAQNYITKTLEAKYGDLQANIDYKIKALEIIQKSPAYTQAEKKQAAAAQTQQEAEKQKLADKKENDGIIQQLALATYKNFPNDTQAQLDIAKAQKSGDVNTALAILGKYQADPVAIQKAILENQYTKAKINELNAKTAEVGIPGITNTDNASKYAGALQVILGSTKLTAEQKKTLINSVNNGQDPVAVIKNQAKQVMTGANQTKIESYETAQSSLKDIAKDLDTFYSNGGKTDIFSGNYEKVINKLGEVNDPKLVELATRIQQNLQIYRNAVSGTAYSVQEGNDIASIFPSITKGQMLNNAIIKGRMQAFEDGIDGAYRGILGSTYDTIKTAEQNNSKGTLSDREFVEQSVQKSGMKYNEILSQAKKGEIAVVDNKDGQIYFITPAEFNSNYTRL